MRQHPPLLAQQQTVRDIEETYLVCSAACLGVYSSGTTAALPRVQAAIRNSPNIPRATNVAKSTGTLVILVPQVQ